MFDSAPADPTAQPTLIPMRPQKCSRHRTRWGTGLVVAVMLHVLPVAAMLYWTVSAPMTPVFEEPVIAVEMIHLQAPPAPPSELPDGKRQVEAAASRPRPEPILRHVVARPLQTDIEPLPAPEPEPQPKPKEATPPAPETTAPAAKPVLPAVVASNAPMTWQTRLMVHLEKHKRYPSQARGQQGTVYVRFTMDRQGRVVVSSLARSSGSPALDRAALDMLKRAQPLPAPPPEVTGEQIEITVPVEFFLR